MSVLVRLNKSLLYQSNVGFKIGKVFSQVIYLLLERSLTCFGVAQLDFESIDSSGFLGFNIKKNMNLHLHLVLLSFDIFQKCLELFGIEFLLG